MSLNINEFVNDKVVAKALIVNIVLLVAWTFLCVGGDIDPVRGGLKLGSVNERPFVSTNDRSAPFFLLPASPNLPLLICRRVDTNIINSARVWGQDLSIRDACPGPRQFSLESSGSSVRGIAMIPPGWAAL